MILNIKTLVGKQLQITVEPTDKVRVIKEKLEEKEDIPPEQQRLIYSGKQMDDNSPVSDYKLEDGAQLHLALALRGGRAV